MRPAPFAVVALLIALPAVPLATAQTDAPLIEDVKGDVRATPLGGSAQTLSGFDNVDLTGLWVWEDPDVLHVKLGLAKIDGQPVTGQTTTWTYLVFDGMEYEVVQYRSSDNEAWFASLYSRTVGDPGFRYSGPLQSRYDVATGQVWTDLARDTLLGASGRTMGRGDMLTGLYAVAFAPLGRGTSFNQPPLPSGYLLDVSDRVPDADSLSLEVRFGGAQSSGPLTLTTQQPYRASNGGETTYVYEMEASNTGSTARDLRLEAMHLPAGWNITLPGTALQMPAGATVTFLVALATPFFHDHGTSRSFHLRLSDPADANAWATAELGVHYLAIPQPAGHHDTLFLHTHPWSVQAHYINAPLGGTDGVLTFNTLQEDPEDSGQPLLAYSSGPGNNEFYGWAGCLDPGLSMGLDFDLGRTGTIRIPVSSQKPVLDATLSGRLLYVPDGDEMQYCFPSEYRDLDVTELATFATTTAAQIGPNGEATFEAVIEPTADRVPFAAGGSLVLELLVAGGGISTAGTAGLTLLPGGSLQLPLQEYSDAVPLFQSGATEGESVAFSDVPAAPAKDSPGLPLALLLVALLCLVRRCG